MEEPHYHGEITKVTPHHRQTLSIDILQRPFGESLVPFVCLSVWNEDDYDPVSEFDLTPTGARFLARHLQIAASLMDGQPEDDATAALRDMGDGMLAEDVYLPPKRPSRQ